jgi:hypothetical protein
MNAPHLEARWVEDGQEHVFTLDAPPEEFIPFAVDLEERGLSPKVRFVRAVDA